MWPRRSLALTARNAQARGLPAAWPKADVDPLPFLGTSWYTHGVSYYLRRVLVSLFLLFVLDIAVILEVYYWQGPFLGFSSGARLAWGVALGVLFLVSFVWPLRNLRHQQERRRAGKLVHPNYHYTGTRRGGSGQLDIGALVRSWSALVGALLAVESVIFLGWFVMLFLMSFRREPGVEHDARLRLRQDAERQVLPKRPPPRHR